MISIASRLRVGPMVRKAILMTVGNRLTRVIGTTTDTYAYSPTANRIGTITTGSNVRTFGYLASGHVSSDVRDRPTATASPPTTMAAMLAPR